MNRKTANLILLSLMLKLIQFKSMELFWIHSVVSKIIYPSEYILFSLRETVKIVLEAKNTS